MSALVVVEWQMRSMDNSRRDVQIRRPLSDLTRRIHQHSVAAGNDICLRKEGFLLPHRNTLVTLFAERSFYHTFIRVLKFKNIFYIRETSKVYTINCQGISSNIITKFNKNFFVNKPFDISNFYYFQALSTIIVWL